MLYYSIYEILFHTNLGEKLNEPGGLIGEEQRKIKLFFILFLFA